MKAHPLTHIRPPSKTLAKVKCGSEWLTLQRPPNSGDIVMQLLYPNPVEIHQVAAHAARVNGRTTYSASAVEYANTILATLQTPNDCEPVDITTLLAVYDSDPALWQSLVNAALEVLGIQDENAHLNGELAWENLFHKLTQISQIAKSPLVHEALSGCRTALATYRPSPDSEKCESLDSLMESQLGN